MYFYPHALPIVNKELGVSVTLTLVHVCACILLLLNTTTKEELHSYLHNTTSKELFYN